MPRLLYAVSLLRLGEQRLDPDLPLGDGIRVRLGRGGAQADNPQSHNRPCWFSGFRDRRSV